MTEAEEAAIVLRALREGTIPMLVGNDAKLYDALLSDIFGRMLGGRMPPKEDADEAPLRARAAPRRGSASPPPTGCTWGRTGRTTG